MFTYTGGGESVYVYTHTHTCNFPTSQIYGKTNLWCKNETSFDSPGWGSELHLNPHSATCWLWVWTSYLTALSLVSSSIKCQRFLLCKILMKIKRDHVCAIHVVKLISTTDRFPEKQFWQNLLTSFPPSEGLCYVRRKDKKKEKWTQEERTAWACKEKALTSLCLSPQEQFPRNQWGNLSVDA